MPMNYDDFIRTRRYVEDAKSSLPYWEDSWEWWVRKVCEGGEGWSYPASLGAMVYGLPGEPLAIIDVKHPAGRWLLNLEDSASFGDDLERLEKALFQWAEFNYDADEWRRFVESSGT
jgi:hypothetical protein